MKPRPQPSYRLHKPSGKAVVTISDKDHYLGPHGSPESHEAYRRLMALWHAGGGHIEAVGDYTVGQLAADYFAWAKGYYQKNSKPTPTVDLVRSSLRPLVELFEADDAADFGPIKLRTLQTHMVSVDSCCRTEINRRVQIIRRAFRWAVSRELVPAGVLASLETVDGLRKGRSAARETEPVQPVPIDRVIATACHLSETLADMVFFQLFTGARPGEMRHVRPCDVDRAVDPWVYRPAAHKTEHHGKDRAIWIGPNGQRILSKYLDRAPTDYCFRPVDVMRARAGKSPLKSRAKATKTTSGPGLTYTKAAYNNAVLRACERAFGMPLVLTREGKAAWRAANAWSPNQLRHTAATEIRAEFGLEAAQVALGHATADVTQVYAERDAELARKVARERG